ncbi:MAG: hypothetical protein ACXABY_27890, partial [Candidatus Thorarchaeota archaeon]
MTVSYSIGKGAITMVDPNTGAPRSISNEHVSYNTVASLLKQGDTYGAFNAMDIALSVKVFSGGKVTVGDGVVMYEDEEVPEMIAEHVLRLQSDGFDIAPLCRFLENLYQNPSRTAVQELWMWLDNAGLTITEEGHFIAWKG